MSVNLASFDAMSPENRNSALRAVREKGSVKRDDFLLVLHALLDSDQQVRMSAKMAYKGFSEQPFFIDVKGLEQEVLRQKIEAAFPELRGARPERLEFKEEMEPQQMARDLQTRTKKAEMAGEWDGPFPQTAMLLNSLRYDTQALIRGFLGQDEKVEKVYIGFYHEPLKPFRECFRSLDNNTAVSIVNLSHVHDLGQLSPAFTTMFQFLERPIYLLVILTSERLVLFLRDNIKQSAAAAYGVWYSQIGKVGTTQSTLYSSVDIETGTDLLKIPQLVTEDALQIDKILKEKSIESIKGQEDFIDRDFDKELARLEMLFKARTVSSSEYMFRKMRLQKMELEKFSDANLEALLAKRFSDAGVGKKLDQEILKKFTAEKTVMFTDIVGYSEKAAEKQLIDTMTLLATHDKMLMPVINQFAGQLIKKIGDALMVRFDDPIAAVNAAREMQAKLIAFNRSSQEKILIRIGINTGTVFIKNQDVFGDAVNVAARMESMAQPGMIFLTEATFRKAGSKIPCLDFGERKVKGQPHPLRVYAVIDETRADQEMLAQARAFRKEMGLEEPPEPVSGSAPLPAAPLPMTAPAREPSTAETGGISLALVGSEPAVAAFEPVPQASAENGPSATPESEFESMKMLIRKAIQAYKNSVYLGKKRNPHLENWFKTFVRQFEKES